MRAATLVIAVICAIGLGFAALDMMAVGAAGPRPVVAAAQEPVVAPVQAVDPDRAARDARSTRVLANAREAERVALAAERIARADERVARDAEQAAREAERAAREAEYLKLARERYPQYSPQVAATEFSLDDRGRAQAETFEWPVDHNGTRDGMRELNEGLAAQRQQQRQQQWQQPARQPQWQQPAQQPQQAQQPQPWKQQQQQLQQQWKQSQQQLR